MSDQIAVMNHGQVIQLGSSEELYERPRTRFVAQFLGGCNLLPARREERRGANAIVSTPIGRVEVPGLERPEATLAIRPEKIALGPGGGINHFTGTVLETTYTGAETHSVVGIGDTTLRVTSINQPGRRMVTGETVGFTLPPDSVIVLED